MQRFGSQMYTPSRKKQGPTLAIYMVITLPKGTYNIMVETFFFTTKLKLLPHVNPHSARCCLPCHNPKMKKKNVV
jgi:hypothetical protein